MGRAASGGAALFTRTRAVTRRSLPSTMPELPPRRRQSPLAVKLIAAFVLLAALYYGRSLVVPVLIGVLVSYALNPIVETLTRWRLPRTLASMIVVLGVLGLRGYARLSTV